MTVQGFRMTNKGRAALIAMKENAKQDEEVPAHYRIADALADAGLLATDLPEENDLDIFASEGKEWIQVCSDVPHVWAAPDGLVMVQRIGPGELTPTEAREVAYALLLAADYSEEQE